MTTPAPAPPAVTIAATGTEFGCTRCGTQKTVQLHPHHGRLCSSHMTLPPGPFRSDLADDIVDFGRADAAFGYLAGWLRREVDRRFAGPIAALGGAR